LHGRKAVSLSLDDPPYRDKTAKGWGTRFGGAAEKVAPLKNDDFSTYPVSREIKK
jgi:hypothetical protein